jgi:TPR repeat protein
MIGTASPCPAELGFRPLRAPLAHLHALPAYPLASHGDVKHRAYPHIASRPHQRRTGLPRSLSARLRALAPDEELGVFLEELAEAVGGETGRGCGGADAARFEAGLPLEPDPARPASQALVQALVHDFRRRQRQASMIVAGCVATSFVLTMVGIAALATFARPAPAEAEPASKGANTVVSHEKAKPAKLILAKAAMVSEPLPLEDQPSSQPKPKSEGAGAGIPKLILVQAGRPLDLAPLLSQRAARYVLFRGLPADATLSAGQRNPSGAWLVKDRDMEHLTLSMASTAGGDYPIEIYALGAASAPQARQRFVFRVAAGPTGGLAGGATSALFSMALLGTAPHQPAPSHASPLMDRAMHLLGEGDIAGARLLFMHLAEQGESDAAYELARTFDGEVLAELGVTGVGPDRTRAVGWYERASESGNAKAAERLKILASLSD